MKKVLLIGASGQLGSVILDYLLTDKWQCRLLVRPTSKYIPPECENINLCRGDLSDSGSLINACNGIQYVISTASSIVPRPDDVFGEDEINNYQKLIKACLEHKIEQFIFISAFSTDYDDLVPEFRVKRKIEQMIMQSGVPYTIFRCAAFMDIYYAVMGSSIAMNSVRNPTLLRGFWLTKYYSQLTSGIVEKFGLALVPGSGRSKHAFICIDDVAVFVAKALKKNNNLNKIIDLGGPEVLSWNDVVRQYEDLLGRKIIRVLLPVFLLNIIRRGLHFFSPAGENMISTLLLLGKYDYNHNMKKTCNNFSVSLTTTKSFLLAKYMKE